MFVAEYFFVLGRVTLQAFSSIVDGTCPGRRDGCDILLRLAELALAVPSVAGLVDVPERVIDRAHRPPEDAVVLAVLNPRVRPWS